MKVCHLTTVHRRHDARIFLKECSSLARAGHEVILLVADGLGNEERAGFRIIDAGTRPSALPARFLFSARHMTRMALAIDADLYHFHDPELMTAGLSLKRRGKRVVFDAHEDTPRQILAKTWGNPLLRKALSVLIGRLERGWVKRLDAVAAATETIAAKFSVTGGRVAVIRNYPILGGVPRPRDGFPGRDVCYVGGLFPNRGLEEMANAARRAGAGLRLAGPFRPESIQAGYLERFAGVVKYEGFLDREGVAALLSRCVAGLVVLGDLPHYRESLPVKLFEYMAAGLPVIASDFPKWREIVEGGRCGICVDPADIEAIAAAIRTLVGNPVEAAAMGARGARLVEERYNWNGEEGRLLELYRDLETDP